MVTAPGNVSAVAAYIRNGLLLTAPPAQPRRQQSRTAQRDGKRAQQGVLFDVRPVAENRGSKVGQSASCPVVVGLRWQQFYRELPRADDHIGLSRGSHRVWGLYCGNRWQRFADSATATPVSATGLRAEATSVCRRR